MKTDIFRQTFLSRTKQILMGHYIGIQLHFVRQFIIILRVGSGLFIRSSGLGRADICFKTRSIPFFDEYHADGQDMVGVPPELKGFIFENFNNGFLIQHSFLNFSHIFLKVLRVQSRVNSLVCGSGRIGSIGFLCGSGRAGCEP